jgi:hypothetical protein
MMLMRNRLFRNHLLSVAALLLTPLGCSSEPSATSAPASCGTGDTVAYKGETYCVFETGLIIEGFMCPDAFPFPFEGQGGAKMCSGEGGLPAEIVAEVIDAWKSEDGTDADVTDAPDVAAPEPDVFVAPPSQQTVIVPSGAAGADWCSPMYEGKKLGEEVLVIDWTCPVTSLCGVGLVAGCNSFGHDYHCRCVNGTPICEEVGAFGTASCPVAGAAVDKPCGAFLGAEACAAGAFCKVAAAGDMWGTCAALTPKCADERSCFVDDDCAFATATAGAPTRCYGGDILKNVLGTCRIVPTLPACMHDRDCPYEFTCEGEALACEDACACDSDASADVPGQCQKITGFSDLNLWLDPTEKRSGDVVVPFWNKGDIGEDSNWISCPSYEVQVEDPQEGWVTVAKELCENEGILIEVAPAQFLARPGFTVTASTPGAAGRFRLRGTYYYGCQGKTGPSQCEGGPYERFTPATYLVK